MTRAAGSSLRAAARRHGFARPTLTALCLVLAVLLVACDSTPTITIPTPAPTQPAATKPSAPTPPPSAPTSAPAPTVPPTASPVAAAQPAVVVPGASPGASPAAAPVGAAASKPIGAVVVPAAPTVPAASQLVGPIKIVSSLPRQGTAKQQTDSIATAIKMALDELGSRVDGASIVYEDWDDSSPTRSAWDADKEAENANKAVADADVMVYIGPYNSGAAKVSIPILNQADLAMVSPSNTYDGLTQPARGLPNEPGAFYPSGKRNYARVVPSDDAQGVAGAAWAKQLGANKVYVLHDADVYGNAIAGTFADAAQKVGLQVVGGPEAYDPRAQSYDDLISKVRTAAPDLIYIAALADNNAGRLVKDVRAALGNEVKIMGPDGLYQQGFLDDAGDAAEGAFITFGAVAPSKLTGKGADWYRSYKVRYNAEPEVYAAYAYEATRVAIDAIRRAGKKDRGAIREALLATKDYEGILGRWSFDANGDTTLTTMSGREVKNGKFDDANATTIQGPSATSQ
jgi:branched-chain amino acid transport system substrate-binding protein